MDGGFSFETTDKDTYPPGEYTFTVTGTVGSASDSVTIPVNIVDPCVDTSLTIFEEFPDLTTYLLGEDSKFISWNPEETLTKETLVDCGTPTFIFKNADDTDISAALFTDVRMPSDDGEFTILY